MNKKLLKVLSVMLTMMLLITVAGCSGKAEPAKSEEAVKTEAAKSEEKKQDEPKEKKTFRIWWYDKDNAMDASWKQALEEFKAKYPEVTVEFEQKGFEQIQETAKMVLSSKDAPDVMEVNKGNGTCGVYAKEGLLTELDIIAEEKGWNKIMSPSIQTTCRYDENGIMGSGKLWAVTTYGEFVMVYYNKDMFDKYNLKIPTSFEEFEGVCDKFVQNKITPMALGAGDKWPQTQNWYELALYKADRNFVTNYQLLKGELDFNGPEGSFAAQKYREHFKKGYYDASANGVKYDDANSAFIQGKYPMMLTGSWLYGFVKDKVKDFKWGIFLMSGKKLNTGSGGNVWIVPKNAKNKELAYEFISITLDKKAQTVMALKGGIPLNADLSQIQDEGIIELNKNFQQIVNNDGLAFYPDWPVPGFIDVLGGGLQDLASGKKNEAQFNEAVAKAYNDHKSSLE